GADDHVGRPRFRARISAERRVFGGRAEAPAEIARTARRTEDAPPVRRSLSPGVVRAASGRGRGVRGTAAGDSRVSTRSRGGRAGSTGARSRRGGVCASGAGGARPARRTRGAETPTAAPPRRSNREECAQRRL